jgi:anti-sigma B factor antagonist
VIATDEPTFSIQAQRVGDTVELVASGEVDLSSAPELRDAILTAVGGGNATIVLDLERVSYLDSSGIHAIYDGISAAQQAGVVFVVAHPARHVMRVLEISLVTDVIEVRDPR